MELDIVNEIEKGNLKLYEIEKITKDVNKAAELRRKFLENKIGVSLENIGKYHIDLNSTYNKNIENAIGCIQIPVGIAGPIMIKGDYANCEFYIPIATTEGALVASVNRGCSALYESGYVYTKILDDKMTRAPLIKVKNITHALEIVEWIKEHFNDIKDVFESRSKHLKLKNIKHWILGRNLWLRFEAESGDAMGMNMVTIATDLAIKYILNHNKDAKLIALSGNLCTDKKTSSINWLLGRGKTVVAEATINRDIVRNKLKTTPEEAVETAYRKNILGSSFIHSYGLNAHFANVVAGIFLATGQDAAQIVESSMGVSIAELNENGDLYVSVYLPSLEVGTVGGGTHLSTQSECLKLLGCYGSGNPPGSNAKKFSEIIAAAVLAGEISLLSALASGHLAKAHEEFGGHKK